VIRYETKTALESIKNWNTGKW